MNSITNSKTIFLDGNDRPEGTQWSISYAYEKLTEQSSSAWGVYNGSAGYDMCGIKEYELFKKIILQNPDRKAFYALDIGCGNFQWCVGLSAFIETQNDLPKDITVHIFGVRGESYRGERVVETDRCKIYLLGAFKVEELFTEFKKQGFDLENNVDLTVTRWCFRHLVDPVGTLARTYNLLRPHTGLFLFDGFFFLLENTQMNGISGNRLMTQLILDTKASFLTKDHGDNKSLNHFILQRRDETPCQLPLSYLGSEFSGSNYQIGSQTVTRFKREPQKEDKEKFHLPGGFSVDNATNSIVYDYSNIYGDKKMYNWLKQNGLFSKKNTPWKPLREKDSCLKGPPLHDAVALGNFEEVKKCLEMGSDINESDSNGYTPLHLSIRMQNYALFQYLLDQNALTELEDNKGHTPLILATALYNRGYLQALTLKGADVTTENSCCRDPLYYAIEAKNLEAIKILAKAGAKITEKHHKALEGPEFSSLYDERIIPLNFSGLKSIYDAIKRGDCIVLYYNGLNGIMYNYSNDSNKNPRLICVDINQGTNLLDEDEWPDFLRLEGYNYSTYDAKKIPQNCMQNSHYFTFGY